MGSLLDFCKHQKDFTSWGLAAFSRYRFGFQKWDSMYILCRGMVIACPVYILQLPLPLYEIVAYVAVILDQEPTNNNHHQLDHWGGWGWIHHSSWWIHEHGGDGGYQCRVSWYPNGSKLRDWQSYVVRCNNSTVFGTTDHWAAKAAPKNRCPRHQCQSYDHLRPVHIAFEQNLLGTSACLGPWTERVACWSRSGCWRPDSRWPISKRAAFWGVTILFNGDPLW